MKKIFLPLFITALLFASGTTFAQTNSIDIGISGNSCDQLIVEWNSSYDFTGAGENQWTQATMTITWPVATGSTVLGTITPLLPGFNNWQYSGSPVIDGANYKQDIILLSGGYTQNVPIGVSEVIAITLDGTGTSDFTVANPNSNTNISHGLHGSSIWTGTFSPATATSVSLDDIIVWDGTEWCGGTGTNFQPGAGDTKPCSITGLAGHLVPEGGVTATISSLDVLAGGSLTIDPGSFLTNSGNTTVAQPQGLIIGADATGSGSYLDNGTISYTGSGSSKVQTYIDNTATAGNLHIHQIGPTVKNPSFGTTYAGETGVFLNEFELATDQTYAYRYTEPTNTWTNFYDDTEPVPTACGMIFSDISGTSSTHEMVGQLATDDGGNTTWIATPSASITPPLSQWAVTYTPGGGEGNFLISNPYPSGFDLKSFWLAHGTANLETSMRIWDHSYGDYASVTRRIVPPGWIYTGACVGTNGIINPGQGFFITTTAGYAGTYADQVYFLSTYRTHYYGPFIKEAEVEFSHTLYLSANTSANNSRNELIIYFAEGLSSGLDDYDAENWASMYPEAIEISSLGTDMSDLTVNAMPALTDMVSIPVNLKPGESGDVSFNFTGLDSFEPGTEVYLEDKQTGGSWINLISNPEYEFVANDDDPLERFVLHFFGPTGIDDPIADISDVQIYGYGQDAYIVNKGKETIKEYVAYDMMGRELHRGTLPNSTVNKVTISDISAYYIVKVFTKEGRIYTDKVYINK